MKRIMIHPLTVPVFILFWFLDNRLYFILYFFIFLHEAAHLLCAVILKTEVMSIHLFPWGCMLSLKYIPQKRESLLILLGGPTLNLILFFLGIFPKENLSLAIFNLIPIIPLDGGVIVNLLFPSLSFTISLFFIALLFISCVFMKVSPLLPILLLAVLLSGRKKHSKKIIDKKVMCYLSKNNVENKPKKLYNVKIE